MRLFVAVEIDDRVRRLAAATAEILRAEMGSALKARWVPPENMHLTVRFIGHVEDARAAAVIAALTPPLDLPPFDVEFGSCGSFPPHGRPRVVWIGLTQGLPGLALMHEEFNRRLRPFGFEPEGRTFNAHLTLARIKEAPGEAARAVRAALGRMTVPLTRLGVTRATVFESHLSPKGSRYEPVAHVALGDGQRPTANR